MSNGNSGTVVVNVQDGTPKPVQNHPLQSQMTWMAATGVGLPAQEYLLFQSSQWTLFQLPAQE
jgi:hypothetical protein